MSSISILVVDDASFVRDMVKRTLRNAFPQATVEEASDGRKAQSKMKRMRFHVILCDWEMPEMSGVDLLKWTRQQEPYEKTPFIMITSRGDRQFVVEAAQAGVTDYLSKPFSADSLSQKVNKALGKNAAQARQQKSAAATSGALNDSASVLTGGGQKSSGQKGSAQKKEKSTTAKGMFQESASLLTGGGKKEGPAKKKASSTGGQKGLAKIRFAETTLSCVIKGITLAEVKLIAKKEDKFPGILDQAVVDIELDDGKITERLNGYVSVLQAVENRQDAEFVSIVIRFVDEDPNKFANLSKYISSF